MKRPHALMEEKKEASARIKKEMETEDTGKVYNEK